MSIALGVAGTIKVVLISLAVGRGEYKLNQLLDQYKPKKKYKVRW